MSSTIYASLQQNLSLGFTTRSDTTQAVLTQKMVKGLKFQIKDLVGLYYLCRENNDADHLPGFLIFNCAYQNLFILHSLKEIYF